MAVFLSRGALICSFYAFHKVLTYLTICPSIVRACRILESALYSFHAVYVNLEMTRAEGPFSGGMRYLDAMPQTVVNWRTSVGGDLKEIIC